MNKYQKAIGSLRWSAELCNLCDMDDVDTLQELVEKATPKKPIITIDEYGTRLGKCPNSNCNHEYLGEGIYEFKHCEECGQALDWSEEDEDS